MPEKVDSFLYVMSYEICDTSYMLFYSFPSRIGLSSLDPIPPPSNTHTRKHTQSQTQTPCPRYCIDYNCSGRIGRKSGVGLRKCICMPSGQIS